MSLCLNSLHKMLDLVGALRQISVGVRMDWGSLAGLFVSGRPLENKKLWYITHHDINM